MNFSLKNVLIILLLFFSIQVFAESSSTVLFVTINERLSYMKDVALYKAINSLPIEDIEREKIVIDNSKLAASEKGLDPVLVEDFFRAQIAVAKAIQFRHRADFLSNPSSNKPKDLHDEIRPALLSLGGQIIERVIIYIKAHGSFKPSQFTQFKETINIQYVTAADKALLFNALLKIKQVNSAQ